MATFEITAPNGKTYQIEGASREGALEALQAHLATQSPTPDPTATPAQASVMSEGLSALSDMTQNPSVAEPAPRSLKHRILDNVVGIDDGILSPGEKVAGLLNRAGEDMTLGLVGDEADAALKSTLHGTDYSETLAGIRANEAQLAEENPYLNATAGILGAIALPGAGIAKAASKGGGLLWRTLAGGAAGGTSAATHAFMEGEGGLNDRANNVPVAAAMGLGLGAAAAPLTSAAKGLWSNFGPGVAANARKVREAAGLDETGARLVANAFERDAPTRAANIAAAGDDAINAMSGPNSKGLLDWVVNRPGQAGAAAQRRIQEMAADAGQSFTRTLDDTFGAANGVARTQRQSMQATAAARRKIYDQAYATPINYASAQGRNIESLLPRVPADVLRKAERLMQTEGADSAQRIARIADDGSVIFDKLPDVRQLDYITRALRDMGGFGVGEGAEQGRVFTGLAREIRSAVDDAVPAYRVARASGQDAILNREAVEFGADLLNRKVKMDVAEDAIADMTTGELAFARQGVRSHVDEIMANTQAALTDQNMDAREAVRPLREMMSSAGRRKLQALLGKPEEAALHASLKETFSVLNLRASVAANSRTAMRTASEEILNDAVPSGAMEAIEEGRGVLAAATAAARPLISGGAASRAARKDSVMSAVGDALMLPAGQNGGLVLKSLAPAMRANQAALDVIDGGSRGILGALNAANISLQN